MQIDTLIAVNWGQLPIRSYDMGTVTLLEGATGAGKSTLEDAIQTVVTAAYSSLFNYNAGQDEVSQTSRSGKVPRTLPSYILGGEENRYLRPQGANGYLAAVFRNSIGEPEAMFTAIVGVSAKLEIAGHSKGGQERRTARVDDLRLMIIKGHALSLEDFVEHEGDGRYRIQPVSGISDHLRLHYPAQSVNDFRDQKKNYLTSLWGALRGRSLVTADEAFRAAKTFSQAMAYKEIKNIHEFVRNEILEKIDFDTEVRSLSESIQTMRRLRDEAEKISQNVDRLTKLEGHGARIREVWTQGIENRVLTTFFREADLRFNIKTAIERHQTAERELAESLDILRMSTQRKEQLDATLTQLGALRSKHQGLVQKSLYDEEIGRLTTRYAEDRGRLGDSLRSAVQTAEAFRGILNQRQLVQLDDKLAPALKKLRTLEDTFQALDPARALKLFAEMRDAASADATVVALSELQQATKGLDAALELLFEAVHAAELGAADVVRTRRQELLQQEESLFNQRDRLAREIEGLEHQRRVEYPKDVRQALATIRENLPHAKPRVLCDLVEVTDEPWQSAIEGYLGSNRFAIIVEPAAEAQATALVKKLNAKIIQGQKAQDDMRHRMVPGDSICHALRVNDAVAKAYLQAQYGSVVKVADREALRRTARGVTKDGYGSGSYSMYYCGLDDDALVFGDSGRKRALEAKYPRLEALKVQCRDVSDTRGEVQALLKAMQSIRLVTVESMCMHMLEALERVVNYQTLVNNLDLSDSQELIEQYDAAEAELKAVEKEREAAFEKKGDLGRHVVTIAAERDRLKKQLDKLLDDVDVAEDELHKLAKYTEGYDAAEAIKRLRLEAGMPSTMEQSIEEQRARLITRMNQAFGQFRNAVVDYNLYAGGLAQLSMQSVLETGQISSWDTFFAFAEAHSQVRSQLKRQRDHVLAGLIDDTKRWEVEVSNAFTTSFCYVINNHIDNGRRQLDALNKILKQHRFTEEVYSFESAWRPDMQEFYRFFKELHKLQEGTNIFAENLFEAEQAAVRDNLMELLLSNDDEKSRRKLEEISDYRNYMTYDVRREREDGAFGYLSEFGTGSGGQFETPGYVLRAAAITSAYRLNSDDSYHCKFIVLDEAFTKMDEPRAVEVLKLLTENMGFQVIFAMPTKNAGPFYPWIDRKYAFSKQPTARPMGELKTRVLVQNTVANRDMTREYWERHKAAVLEQAILAFEAEEQAEVVDG